MNGRGGYGQFCPVSMASEVLCGRWTMLILRELLAGSTRFNELRRGVPRMSPALLSKRLKELEECGVVARRKTEEPGVYSYELTPAGQDAHSIVAAMGIWGQRWLEGQLSLKNLDPTLLMWDMRRNLDPAPMPRRRCVVQFVYRDQPSAKRNWWLVIADGGTDLCWTDPGFEVDLYVHADLRAMTAVWMGLTTVRREIEDGRIELAGDKQLGASMQRWLRLSPFAKESRRIAAVA